MKNLILLCTLLLILSACSKQPVPVEPEPVPAAPSTANLSPEKQQQEAIEVFKEILTITQRNTKQEAFSKLEEKYSHIIDYYPKAKIAREAYIRLMHLYITNNLSENLAEAEVLLQRFLTNYPDDPMGERMRRKLDETLK